MFHLIKPVIGLLVGVDIAVFAAEIGDAAPLSAGDIPSLILNEGVSIAIVVLFIVGQWTNRIVFVNKDHVTQLDRIEDKVNKIAAKP